MKEKKIDIRLKKTKMLDEAVRGHKPSTLIIAILVFILVFFIASVISQVLFGIPESIIIFSNDEMKTIMDNYQNGVITFEEYIDEFAEFSEIFANNPPLIITLVSLLVEIATIATAIFYCVKFEKRPISSMGFRKKGAVLEYVSGLAIGAVLFGIVALFAYVTGSVEISLNNKIQFPLIIAFFIGFLILGMAQEVIYKGYFMITVARDNSLSTAVVASSVAFAVMNIGYGVLGFVNSFIFSAVLGIYVFRRGNIWGACAIHGVWNFAQMNIFGISVDGTRTLPTLFNVTLKEGRNVINGGEYGYEGGVAVTVILLIALAIALLIPTKKSELSITEMIAENE